MKIRINFKTKSPKINGVILISKHVKLSKEEFTTCLGNCLSKLSILKNTYISFNASDLVRFKPLAGCCLAII